MNNGILVIGSSNTDMTVKSRTIPVPGETVLGDSFTMGPGGKGANQAVAAARLGSDVTFVCKVGNDLFGDNSVRGYEKEGIDTRYVLRSEKASGVALILVDEKGENCISVASGANNDITEDDIEKVSDVIRSSKILILQLEIPVPAVLKAAKIAHEAGVYVILNPAPACELPSEIYQYLDLLTPNQTETAILSGQNVEDNETLLKAADVLKGMGVKEFVITLGSKGSLVYADGKAEAVPALRVKAVDTTAAGDTFCGAIAVALCEGKDLKSAAQFATKASAFTVQKMGAQASIPYRKDII